MIMKCPSHISHCRASESPSARLVKKRPRLATLVLYDSSPEKNSDIEMLDHDPSLSLTGGQSDDTLPFTTESEMDGSFFMDISSDAEEPPRMDVTTSVMPDVISSGDELPRRRGGLGKEACVAPPSNAGSDDDDDERPAIRQREQTTQAGPSKLGRLMEAKWAAAGPVAGPSRWNASDAGPSIAGPSRNTGKYQPLSCFRI